MDSTNETTNVQRLGEVFAERVVATLSDRRRAEHRLLAAAWRDPGELARVCDCLRLHEIDFADRLVGIAVGYVRWCSDRGVTPSLNEAERLLTERAVPRDRHELYDILQSPTAGKSIPDLALEVQQGADERTSDLCRSLARDGLRTLQHAFNCSDCIRCSQGKRRSHKAWRLPRYDRATA